jgi:adenosylhomocysteinase
MVYDTNPVQQIHALCDGFAVPDRTVAFGAAELILGASGTCSVSRADFPLLRPGAILASCSSRDVEFDLDGLRSDYTFVSISSQIARYYASANSLLLLADGRPINFIDRAVLGPVLALVQAEMLMAISLLQSHRHSKEIITVSDDLCISLAREWLAWFVDGAFGGYRGCDDARF